jgi:uncharacterized protein YjfI (DUF2170 family)
MAKYKDNLNYYSHLKSSEQTSLAVDIITDLERYRSLLLVMKENGDLNFYAKNKTVFNTYIEMFERFDEKKNKETSKYLLKMQQNLYFAAFFYFEINRYHDEFYWIKTHYL